MRDTKAERLVQRQSNYCKTEIMKAVDIKMEKRGDGLERHFRDGISRSCA